MPTISKSKKTIKTQRKTAHSALRSDSGQASSGQAVASKTVLKASKFSVPVFDLEGKKRGVVDLSREIFGNQESQKLIAQAVRVYLANQRQGASSTKTRGEVAGSTRKIYRQKGTGRARHGASTAPIFVGGGIAFGPRPRDFSLKLSRKMKKKALFSALSAKLSNDKVFVVNSAGLDGKTKQAYQMFKAINLTKHGNANKVLFVTDDKNAVRASRNIRGLNVLPTHTINTYDVLASNYVVIAKDSLPNFESVFLRKGK